MTVAQHMRYALIPTHDRHDRLETLVASLATSVDVVVVIDNASQPPVTADYVGNSHVIYDDEQPPNLSRMWNVGFDYIQMLTREQDVSRWSIGVFNDDTELPSGWYDAVDGALRSGQHGHPAIACGALGPWVNRPTMKTERDNNIMTRMTPHAFIIRGELGLRADEELRWWWGDTDLDWQARDAGGVLIIPGYIALNSCANSQTVGVLAEQAGRDAQTFATKWGYRPW